MYAIKDSQGRVTLLYDRNGCVVFGLFRRRSDATDLAKPGEAVVHVRLEEVRDSFRARMARKKRKSKG